jgi:hypothetical protein
MYAEYVVEFELETGGEEAEAETGRHRSADGATAAPAAGTAASAPAAAAAAPAAPPAAPHVAPLNVKAIAISGLELIAIAMAFSCFS